MIIGIDFDGTCVEHEYPYVGDDIGASRWLIEAQKLGARFILFTMRDGPELVAAAEWFALNGIALYGTNVNPTQWTWTMSPKAYCHLYVDDNALGIPTKGTIRPHVDWEKAGPMLIDEIKRWNQAHPRGGREVIRNLGRYYPEGVTEIEESLDL